MASEHSDDGELFLVKSKKNGVKSQKAEKKTPSALRRAVILAYQIEYGVKEPKNIVRLMAEHGTIISVSRFSQIFKEPKKLKHSSIKNILAPIKSRDSRREIIYAFAHAVYGNVSFERPGTEVFDGEVTEVKAKVLPSLLAAGQYHRVMRAVLGGLECDPPPKLREYLFWIGIRAALRAERPGIGLDLVRSWLSNASGQKRPVIEATCHYYRAALLFGTSTAWIDRCLEINSMASKVLRESDPNGQYIQESRTVDLARIDVQRLNMKVAWIERSLVKPESDLVSSLISECEKLRNIQPLLNTQLLILESRLRVLSGDRAVAGEILKRVAEQVKENDNYLQDSLILVEARSKRISDSNEEAEEFLWDALDRTVRKQEIALYKKLEYELALVIDDDIKRMI